MYLVRPQHCTWSDHSTIDLWLWSDHWCFLAWSDHIGCFLTLVRVLPQQYHSIINAWASDGSMIPSPASLLDKKQVTLAVTGPLTSVLKISGVEASIWQGEVTGLISASLFSNDFNKGPPQILYTDHKNSVNLIDDLHTNTVLTWKKLCKPLQGPIING